MSKRPQSVFASAKLFVETSVGLTTDTVTLVRNELQHTSRLNALENDLEYDDTVISALDNVIADLAKVTGTTESDEFKRTILKARLEKLKALV